MLRADRADVASYARVLTSALARRAARRAWSRSSSDAGWATASPGRDGRTVAVVVHGADRELELREGARGVEAQVRQVVRGVVISRRTVGVDEWLHALAEDLTRLAARDAAARAALERFLGG